MIQRTTTMLLYACLCLSTILAGRALADEQGPTAKQVMADAYIRHAVALTGYNQAIDSSIPNELAITTLDASLGLNPDNAQAWAMRLELARASQDRAELENILGKYLASGIRDDSASYELIRLRLAKSETLDAQYQTLERLLDSGAGRALADPLRSRLASYASTLASEQLDEAGRRKWAVEAARTDPANAQAAQTMYQLVMEMGGDNIRQAAALVNVIRASPLDPAPRLALASILASQSAYAAAANQYRLVATKLSTQPLPVDAYISWAQCLAITGQDELALQLIDEFDKALNPPADEANPDQPELEPAPLPLEMQLVRLAVLDEQPQAGQKVFDKVAKRLRQSAAEEQDDQTKAAYIDQLAMLAAAFSPNLESVEKIIAEHRAAEGTKDWVNTVAQGWLTLRKGNKPQAQALLGPVADKHSLASCGLAIATGQDDVGRSKLLQQVIRDIPAGSPASIAAGRVLKRLDQAPLPTAAGQAILNHMSKYPSSFWRVDIEFVPWIEARFTIEPGRIKPLQPVNAEVTVWNTTRFPIGVGENSPIKPNAVIVLNASTSGRALPAIPPIVVNLERRITLAAGERLAFDTRLDYHQFGMIRQGNPNLPIVFNAELIVNPALSQAGEWQPSGIGRNAEVRNCLIEASPPTLAKINQWLTALEAQGKPEERLHALARLASLSKTAQPELIDEAMLEQIRPRLMAAWDAADEYEQALIILNANGLSEPETAAYPQLVERIKTSDHKAVWLAMLISQVRTSDAPLLSDAVRRQDLTEVSRYAEKFRRLMRRIEAQAKEAQEQQAPAPAE